MVAYEFFDSTTRNDILENKNKPLRDKLQDSLDKYNKYIKMDNNAVSWLLDEIKKINKNSTISTEDKINKIKKLKNIAKIAIPEENKIILTKLKNVEDISNSNISKVNAYKDGISGQITSEGDNVSSELTKNSVMGDEKAEYNTRLDNTADDEKILINKMKMHEGEFEDSTIKMKSYRFQSVVFSLVFIIILGILIRAVLTEKSNIIETIILFIVIAFAVYYIIDYIYKKYGYMYK